MLEAGHTPSVVSLDWEKIGEVIDRRQAGGEKTWTAAYMIRAESNPRTAWSDWGKGQYIARIVVGNMWERGQSDYRELIGEKKLQPIHERLKKEYGWGSFTAGQVLADWTWTTHLDSARDLYTWAPQGPGSVRGANRLLGRPLKTKFNDEEWRIQLQEWRHQIIDELGQEFADLTLMDVQNCLCEFDKYERVRLGEGRPRSYYRPETAY
jgi:hypothetical protein